MTEEIKNVNAKIDEGDLLMATYEKEATKLSIEVIKGGFLKLPQGAQEALKTDVETRTESPLDVEDAPKDDSEA